MGTNSGEAQGDDQAAAGARPSVSQLAQSLAQELALQLGERASQALLERLGGAYPATGRRSSGGRGDRGGAGGQSGLREAKKRQTREQISDVATTLFIARGFDNVTVAEVAAAASVSEKTVYNYFPSKESLVFDHADEQIDQLIAAVRDRPAGTSPSSALSTTLIRDLRLDEIAGDDTDRALVSAFAQLVNATPALRAAWSEHRRRMTDALSSTLAAEFGIDPRDPEPLVMARSLTDLLELSQDSMMRHLERGLDGAELHRQIELDITRGARLLETGFWSVGIAASGARTRNQLQDAAAVAEQSRQLVAAAMQEAKASWREMRDQLKREFKDNTRREREEDRKQTRRAREAAKREQSAKHVHKQGTEHDPNP